METRSPPTPAFQSNPRSRAEYQRQRRALLHDLYFPSAQEKARLQAMAGDEGFPNFNAWVLLKLYAGLEGTTYPAGYVEGLQADLERTRDWLESSRDEAIAYRSEVKTLQSQKETLLLLLHELPGGPEVAARFLQASAAQVAGLREVRA